MLMSAETNTQELLWPRLQVPSNAVAYHQAESNSTQLLSVAANTWKSAQSMRYELGLGILIKMHGPSVMNETSSKLKSW